MTQSFKADEKKKPELVFNNVKSKAYVDSIAKLISVLTQNKGSVNIHVHVSPESDREGDSKAAEICNKLNDFLGHIQSGSHYA